MMQFSWTNTNYRKLTIPQATEKILQRAKDREYFYSLLIKLFCVCRERGLRLIVENPWTIPTYLHNNFVQPPSYIDHDRSRRGDYFIKPTAYWFVNCEPQYGFTWQRNKESETVMSCKRGIHAGICSEERSMISSDYARNFICDQILGISQPNIDKQLRLEI
jgi:hypothetical protein